MTSPHGIIDPKDLLNHTRQKRKKVSLQLLLITPFVLQLFAAVGLTGYLSLRHGRKAIEDLASQLQSEVSKRIDLRLDSYMVTPRKLAQENAELFQLELLNPHNVEKIGDLFLATKTAV
jgi:hypothetical protein